MVLLPLHVIYIRDGYAGSMLSLAPRLPIGVVGSADEMLVCVDTLGLARVSFLRRIDRRRGPGARSNRQSHSSDQSCRSAQAIAPVPRE